MAKTIGTFQKLSKRIEDELGIKTGFYVRNRPGYWQRSAGAFSFSCSIINEDGQRTDRDLGSSYSATELLKHKGKLSLLRNGEIVPD